MEFWNSQGCKNNGDTILKKGLYLSFIWRIRKIRRYIEENNWNLSGEFWDNR